MVHLVRTGNRDALRIGLASALHYLDVDTIHYSAPTGPSGPARSASTATAPMVITPRQAPTCTMRVTSTDHPTGAAASTGEPIGILGARGIAGWTLSQIDPEANVGGMERALGHALVTTDDAYEATWEDPSLWRGSAARRSVSGLETRTPVHNWAPWLLSPRRHLQLRLLHSATEYSRRAASSSTAGHGFRKSTPSLITPRGGRSPTYGSLAAES